jgi:hypothetical protein
MTLWYFSNDFKQTFIHYDFLRQSVFSLHCFNRAVVVTFLAGASGACSLWPLLSLGDLAFAMNGLLSGLVATCSGVNVHNTWSGRLLRSVLVYGECPPDWQPLVCSLYKVGKCSIAVFECPAIHRHTSILTLWIKRQSMSIEPPEWERYCTSSHTNLKKKTLGLFRCSQWPFRQIPENWTLSQMK